MADYKYLNETGVIVPDTETLLTEVETEWRTALGEQLVTTPDTPQGVLITSEVVARETVVANNAALANQINPNIAGGVFLDAICALLGLERTPAVATRVLAVTLGGVVGTTVPAGSQARSIAGDLYATTVAVIIGTDGTVLVDMLAVDAGPVTCPPGTLTTVVDMVLGWETVNNTTAGIVGVDQQSDNSLRQLRRVTLARQGISTREAQLSALNDLDDVRSAVYRENYTDADATIDGVFLLKHSVWACVYGGTDAEVAGTLLENKTDGAAWNGAITVPVVDPISGQTYSVKFDRAVAVPVFVTITVRRNNDTADATVVVPQAIVSYANGEIPGDAGLGIGVAVSPFELSAAVNYFHPGFTVTNVLLTLSGGTPGPGSIAITLKQIALIDASYVTVIVV